MSSWFSLWWENSCFWFNLVFLWLKFSGHLFVLVICTPEFITHCFSRKLFFTVPVILCISVHQWLSCVWMFDTFCFSLLILSHYSQRWCLIWLLSFFNWNLVCGGQCDQLDYPCAPEIKMHLPVDTWSDVVCDSQVKCLIWTSCFAWVSCPVSKVLNYSCI